ncbi:MAG: GNAT family N-acetyltransferase [Casimicrobiaceae bacterium]
MRRSRRDDADFIIELLNDPGWLEFIGNRNIRSRDDAQHYIETVLQAMVARTGFGLDIVERKADHVPIGLCGLVKRDELEDVDLGFALLPAWRGAGYAREAARAVLDHCVHSLELTRVAAIASTRNQRSIHLLQELGFAYQRELALRPHEPPVDLYLRRFESA